MGKKKERGIPVPGKRRTVLQIEGPSVSSKRGPAYGQSQAANALSGLMANYGDSDDDQEQELETRKEVEPGKKKPKTEMDAKLADFMAEIDAMDTASNSPIDTDGKADEAVDGKPIDGALLDGKPINAKDPGIAAGQGDNGGEVPNPELTAIGEWQELLDENTNCVYYWNMYSNEVTWEMPDAFRLQQELLQQQQQQQLPDAALPTMPVVTEAKAEDTDGASVAVPEANQQGAAQNGDISDEKIVNGLQEAGPAAEGLSEREDASSGDKEKISIYGSARDQHKQDSVMDDLEEIVKDDLRSQSSEDGDGGVVSPKRRADKSPDGDKRYEGSDDEGEKRRKEEEEEEEEDDESDDGRYDLYQEPEKETTEDSKKSKDELYAVDMFADDVDDIDQQLEMALEKKKAELKELEEAEGKSSPQPPSKTDKGKKRKQDSANLASIYDESGEVDLSQFKKKRLENLKQKNSAPSTQETGVQCDLEGSLTEEELDKVKQKRKLKEEAEKKEEIVDFVSTMMNKLEFLGISNKGLNKFQIMLIEMETRVQDWREGYLDSKHLLSRLESSSWELTSYEKDAAPSGWLCSWDRTHKQYYYTNLATNESQWDYPLAEAAVESKGPEATLTREQTRYAFSNAADRGAEDKMEEENSGEESMDEGDSSDEGPVPPQPSDIELPSDLPPGQPPPPPMPDDTLPLPPLPEGPPPPPPPGEEPPPPPLPPSPPPPSTPPAPPPDDTDPSRPLTPPPFLSALTHPTQPPPPPPPNDTTGSSTAIIGKPQVLYSAPAVTTGAATIAAAPVLSAPPTGISAPPRPHQPAAPPTKTKTKKKKKEKEPKMVKSKLPHSLVSRWSKIKEEQEKEMEESEESEEEDMSVRNQKIISEWKKQQLTLGKAKYNANFEEISGNWRERLKRKSNAPP